MEGRNLVGFVREWDFFFLRFFFFFRFWNSLLTVERYTRSLFTSPAYFECCFAFRALYEISTRLLCVPSLYRSFGVRNPYFGRPLPSRPVLPSLEVSYSDFNSSSRSEEERSGSDEEPSSSGSSEHSPLLPSISLFNRNSRGRVLN